MGLFLPAPPVQAGLPARSGVSFAGAVAGHVLVLALILVAVPAERIAEVVRPMAVRLIEPAPKLPLPEPPRPKEMPQPAKVQPVMPMPVLTAQPAVESPAPVAFAVAPQPPAPPAPAPIVAPAPEPAVVAPRFDADYLHNPKPNYPPASRRLGEEGKVVLRVQVGAGGEAGKVEVKTTSGFARLDAAAQDAVARWRFVPARRGDEAVAAWVLVPITFSLES